jgi:hypothetical protein
MKNFESLEVSNAFDDSGNVAETIASNESEAINKYWRKFRLPGTPPEPAL